MKIFKNSILAAAIALISFTSCDNNDAPNVVNGDTKTVSFQLAKPGTRAVGGAQGATQVHLEIGTLIFADAAGRIINVYTMNGVAGPTNFTKAQLEAGVTITDVGGAASVAYFVGNTNVAAQAVVNGNISAVTSRVLEVESQMQNVAVSNVAHSNVVNMFGQEALTLVSVATATDNALYTATITVEPTIARVELFNIAGNEHIHSFKVTGVFVEEYYHQATVGGALIGNYANNATGFAGGLGILPDHTKFDFNHTNFVFTSAQAGALFDWHNPALTSALGSTIAGYPEADWNVVVPGANSVWGYNLFAQRTSVAVPGSKVPKLIIRLEEVYVETVNATTGQVIPGQHRLHALHNEGVVPALFVTIRGFDGVNPLTGFQPRHVYKIGDYENGGDAWSFTPEDITTEPDQDAIDVQVQIQVLNWVPTHVNPSL